jgi:hypothetical protein
LGCISQGYRHDLTRLDELLYCPFSRCTQHKRADKPSGFTTPKLLKEHLQDLHVRDLHRLSDDQLTTCGIILCRQCEECICEDEDKLETHQKKVHLQKRSTTNKDIVTKHLFSEVSSFHRNHWDEGLAFLTTTTFSQATFRQTLITKISFGLEQNVLRAYYDVLQCCVEAHKSASNSKLSKTSDFDPTPIWILPFVFERLVLAPNPNKNPNPAYGCLHKDITNKNKLRPRGRLP